MIRQKVVEEVRQAGHDLLLPEEAAEIARVSIITIYRNVRSGKLKARRVGEGMRIERKEFLEWLSTEYST